MQTERGNLPEKSLISRNPQKFLEIPKLFKSLHFPMRVGYNSKHPEGEGICMFFFCMACMIGRLQLVAQLDDLCYLYLDFCFDHPDNREI